MRLTGVETIQLRVNAVIGFNDDRLQMACIQDLPANSLKNSTVILCS